MHHSGKTKLLGSGDEVQLSAEGDLCLERYTVSIAMARSVKLGVLETLLKEYQEGMRVQRRVSVVLSFLLNLFSRLGGHEGAEEGECFSFFLASSLV